MVKISSKVSKQGRTAAAAKPAAKTKGNPHRVTRRLTIRDRLGQLTIRAAERLLGDQGAKRLRQGGKIEIDVPKAVRLTGDSLFAAVPDTELPSRVAQVTIVEMSSKPNGLHLHCDVCKTDCHHIAATLHMVLESKLILGLSEVPDPHEPIENLSPKELIARAISERQQRSQSDRMLLKSTDASTPWADYTVTSQETGNTYRVSMRGLELGRSYCSCPDFRTNQLGTCKHILFAKSKMEKRFSKDALAKPYARKNLSLRMHYGDTTDPEIGLRFNLPNPLEPQAAKLLKGFIDKTTTDVSNVVRVLRELERAGTEVTIYPDAETFMESQLLQKKLQAKSSEIRLDPTNHPYRTELLKVELLPYQLDGIAFAVGAGRAILADDMGLGKTIQGIGTAELLKKFTDIKNVLVVTPASLKSQWASEIARFCNRSHRIILGSASERAEQYSGDGFFKIANYEQIMRDEAIVSLIEWDLIILDEGQRIKNWESKTTRVFQKLRSKFALVLSGTPLENRLEELFTVVRFVDNQRLGPAYRFFHRHRVVNEDGRISGYKNLDQLREMLKPILLRRTRQTVMQQLPERTTEIVRIRPTDEQKILSDDHVARAAQIASKAYITEMDLLRLQKHLLMARMACDSTFLVDKHPPGYSSKLETLDELLEQLSDEESRKIILFSEWTTMLTLIEPLFKKHGMPFVRLDGQVPQKQRQQIVHTFQTDPNCRAILMSNAGATGLNLQSANTVINVDLPWNPAVLEQRIARAHRMGQKNPVQVFLLITEDTIEERMLATLASKHELAMAALDVESDVSDVKLESGMEELKRRLEKLLGEKPTAPIDQSEQIQVAEQTEQLAERRERVASASGELLGAAIQLVSQLLDNGTSPPSETVAQISQGLSQCVDRDAEGRIQLRLTLPNDAALQSLAASLAKLLVKQ